MFRVFVRNMHKPVTHKDLDSYFRLLPHEMLLAITTWLPLKDICTLATTGQNLCQRLDVEPIWGKSEISEVVSVGPRRAYLQTILLGKPNRGEYCCGILYIRKPTGYETLYGEKRPVCSNAEEFLGVDLVSTCFYENDGQPEAYYGVSNALIYASSTCMEYGDQGSTVNLVVTQDKLFVMEAKSPTVMFLFLKCFSQEDAKNVLVKVQSKRGMSVCHCAMSDGSILAAIGQMGQPIRLNVHMAECVPLVRPISYFKGMRLASEGLQETVAFVRKHGLQAKYPKLLRIADAQIENMNAWKDFISDIA